MGNVFVMMTELDAVFSWELVDVSDVLLSGFIRFLTRHILQFICSGPGMVSLHFEQRIWFEAGSRGSWKDLRILFKVTSFIATHNSLKRIGTRDSENLFRWENKLPQLWKWNRDNLWCLLGMWFLEIDPISTPSSKLLCPIFAQLCKVVYLH